MGSGGTGVAAVAVGGLRFLGIEKDKDYYEIARSRIKSVCRNNGRKKTSA